MKKDILLLSASLLLISVTSFAQDAVKVWESYFEGALDGIDESRSIILDEAGNSYITGQSFDLNSNGNFTTVKYDSSGNQLWHSSDNGSQSFSKNEGRKLVMDKWGNIYGTGTLTYHSGDLAIIKYNANGKIWAKSYEPYWFGSDKDFGVDIAVDTFGNIYTVSQITSLDGELWNLYTMKTDSSGEKLFEDNYSSASGDDYAEGIAISPAGIPYALASCFNFWGSSTYDIHTIKYLDSGVQDWQSKYDGAGVDDDYGTCIRVDANENTYVCGIADAGSNNDMVAYKQNLYGTRFWTVTYNGTANGNDSAVAISYLPDGLVAVTGNSLESEGKAIVTMLIDSGTVLWTQKYFGTDQDGAFAKAMTIDANGNIYICGFEKSVSGSDGVILMYNQSGQLVWSEVFDGIDNLSDRFNDIKVSDSLEIFVTGQSYTSSANANYVTVKYMQTGVATGIATAEEENNNLHVFPNPAATSVAIIQGSFKKGDVLKIFDTSGKQCYTSVMTESKNDLHLSLKSFGSGMYMVILQSDDAVKQTRMVVQKQ